ncbi:hypothetical protein E1B28_004559 [Marasmius oreades]|uniref:Transcription initiation factor TFIID subunit 8 n=1 Tax=Marasmius oreades TaxID=181124 RepID=A0A9P7UYW6_9AGAR|nr:uncharacterized protein E1B28_004559 [Marasmius oreades]KAG7097187.1 hypothetical protein E1B28_004559 [Marasmius oreades]
MSINPYPMVPASAFANLPTNLNPSTTAPVPKPNFYPAFPHLQLSSVPNQPSQEPPRPPSPAPPAVTPTVASKCVRKLITSELKGVQFDGAQGAAMERLEQEVVAFVQRLYHRAHEYAELSNRAGPVATDLLRTCDDYGISTESLRKVKSKTLRRRRKAPDMVRPHQLTSLEPRSPSPELLPSDDEETPASIPATIRSLPNVYPALPPKHTYLQTPISPPKRAALPSLEKKLKTAGLVQESLKNLLLATEDNSNQEDAELLGHIVNWEVNVRPRKKWKVGRT